MFLACLGNGPFIDGCANVCIPSEVAKLVTLIYNLIKVIVPIVLVIIGMYDMAKAITTQSADDIKKAQKLLVRKAIAGALVFFLFSFITWMLSILDATSGGTQGEADVIKCLNNLFSYKSGSNEKDGSSTGYTDAGSVCRNNGYDGVLKIHTELKNENLNNKSLIENNYYYVCYSNTDTNTCEIGYSYVFSDNSTRCVANFGKVSNNPGPYATFSVIVSENSSYNHECSDTNMDCNACCQNANYNAGYTLHDNQKCLCANKR